MGEELCTDRKELLDTLLIKKRKMEYMIHGVLSLVRKEKYKTPYIIHTCM